MNELDILRDLLVIFSGAVVVVVLLRKLGIPTIVGFIVTGVLVGPEALKLVNNTHEVEVLAEVGVVLLLFGIGLELSLSKLRRLWKAIIIGGSIQVILTILSVVVIGYFFELSLNATIFLGFIIAVSSTAIVLRGLSSRGELDTPHGRFVLGILVFQDLCVIPMILAIPFLTGWGGSGQEAAIAIGKAILILVIVILAGRFLVPRLLEFVARTRQRELFVLALFLICIGTAWILSQAGISLALGAFLAGLVVSGSEYRHQALSELIPFREVLASVFFISVGMMLDPAEVVQNTGSIIGLLSLILFGKFLIVFLTASLMKLPFRIRILTGAALAQVGEFAFVILKAGGGSGILDTGLYNNLLAAIILSMLITPLAIAYAPRLAREMCKVSWLTQLMKVKAPEEVHAEKMKDHVIIAGYGLTGQELSEELLKQNIPFVVADLNIDNIHRANRDGRPVVLGDISSPQVLIELGLEQAGLLVVAINDSKGTEMVIKTAKQINSSVPVIARTQYADDTASLLAAGANEVITSEYEAAREIRKRVTNFISNSYTT
ncbi:MAG: cation:proton antiporter [Candidatus Electryonea clarkiae]|nr:cation:proton antiporter [Candidatus Electryonea clarkiae]MDP8287880.1 cation:proton antiporter [Candidatus Electryonea clarkiae]